MTILVYMCGADLESENGMASSDLKEMVNASLSDKVNVLVYTGGARKWKNNVVSAKVNQIYRIQKGSLERLVENDGKDSMTSPKTLSRFIQYGAQNYPANRMVLIFWDHGGGSVSGYGYDERYSQGQTMTLAGINEALANGGVKFDFIGFDTCLMSTVENGLMLESYADYMIASEESEPGVGWYYTNWLNKVSKNTSMSTVEIGKTIVDDFVEVQPAVPRTGNDAERDGSGGTGRDGSEGTAGIQHRDQRTDPEQGVQEGCAGEEPDAGIRDPRAH